MGLDKQFSLTREELLSFKEKGFIGPFTAYEPEEMAKIWKQVRLKLMDRSNAIYGDESAISGATNIANYDRHLDVDELAAHLANRKIVDRVNSILGENLLCWRSEFFPKYPGDEGTDWHQAGTFANASGSPQILWPEEENMQGTITVWTAFTDSTKENGCLQLMPGTHRKMHYDENKVMEYESDKINRMEKDDLKRGFFGYDYRQLQIDPNFKPDESKAFPLVMKAGQFVIFWSTLMHGSLAHTGSSTDYRMGFVGRYVPTRVRVYPDTELVVEYGGKVSLDKYAAALVSGENEYDFNKVVTENRNGFSFLPLEENVYA